MDLRSKYDRRAWRVVTAVIVTLLLLGAVALSNRHQAKTTPITPTATSQSSPATQALAQLAVKPAASSAGYERTDFGNGWATVGECDMREHVLNRDLINVKDRSATDCTVLTGTLSDPYTGKTIQFVRGPGTSTKVQIDHVVALGNSWQTGAQQLSAATREQMYNDPLELLAVSGPANDEKGDSDASAWLPANKAYDCRYVARQIAVKLKYHLWVTSDEHTAMANTLQTCPTQRLPIVSQ